MRMRLGMIVVLMFLFLLGCSIDKSTNNNENSHVLYEVMIVVDQDCSWCWNWVGEMLPMIVKDQPTGITKVSHDQSNLNEWLNIQSYSLSGEQKKIAIETSSNIIYVTEGIFLNPAIFVNGRVVEDSFDYEELISYFVN